MTINHHSKVPPDTEIFTGPRGALYYMRNGKRVYLSDNQPKKREGYKPPIRGAFARYLANQKSSPSPLENSHDQH